MDKKLPNAKSARSAEERAKLKRVIERRGLTGLANDTKWDELVAGMRARTDWRPSYRFKCIDGKPSGWDVEWFHHLPFPLVSVEWLDISCQRQGRTPRDVVDESASIEVLVRGAGLDYRKGRTMIRVFGYSPRSEDLFED